MCEGSGDWYWIAPITSSILQCLWFAEQFAMCRFTGVSYNIRLGKYEAYIHPPGERRKICLGHFDDETVAAKVADQGRIKHV